MVMGGQYIIHSNKNVDMTITCTRQLMGGVTHTVVMGTHLQQEENLTASKVAEVTINLRLALFRTAYRWTEKMSNKRRKKTRHAHTMYYNYTV